VELIGTFAIQIAKHQGLKVFVTAGSDSTSIKRKKGALEGLAVVVNRVTCSAPVPGSTLYVHPVTPAVPYLLTELAGCSVGCGE